MLYGMRLARKIAEQPALKPYVAGRCSGAAVTTDEALIEHRATAVSRISIP